MGRASNIIYMYTPHSTSILIIDNSNMGTKPFLIILVVDVIVVRFWGAEEEKGRESKGARKQKKNIKEMSIGSHYFILN